MLPLEVGIEKKKQMVLYYVEVAKRNKNNL